MALSSHFVLFYLTISSFLHIIEATCLMGKNTGELSKHTLSIVERLVASLCHLSMSV